MTPDVVTANTEAARRLVAAEPELVAIAPLIELVPELGERTLLHAGPPFADPRSLPAPVVNAAAAAILLEGWATDGAAAMAALAGGEVRLRPAQDVGVVTPLAFVAGPRTAALMVRDRTAPHRVRVAPLNDGPLPHALRLGTGRAEGVALARALNGNVGTMLADHLAGPIPLLPLFAHALAHGDDLHGRLDAAQGRVRGMFDGALEVLAADALEAANQFVLNIVMAGCAVMLAAAEGVAGSTMAVAAGGNGQAFGWKTAGDPQRWIVRPASPPVGPRLAGQEDATALPAIGDSAVIDATGLGAACLRFAPDLAGPLAAHVDPVFLTAAAHRPFLAAHPALPATVRVGLAPDGAAGPLGVMLAILDAEGRAGLIGRGVAPWPR